MLSDLIFIALVLGLPIFVSVRLFQREPSGRTFLATYALAVIGSTLLFAISAFVLMVIGVGGLGPFDGFFELVVSLPIVLIVGFVVRRQRHRSFVRLHAQD